jgi:hypothetical protein
MTADIHQWPAAASGRDDSPIVNWKSVCVPCNASNGKNSTELSRVNQLLNSKYHRVKTSIVCHSQANAGGIARRSHLLAFGWIECHRFFDQNMFASGGSGDRLWQVAIDWRGNVDGVQIRQCDQVIGGCKPVPDRKPICKLMQFRFAAAANGNQFGVVIIFDGRRDTFVGNVADTN